MFISLAWPPPGYALGYNRVRSGGRTTFDVQRSVVVGDSERDAATSLGVVEPAQLRDVLLAPLVNVNVARCSRNTAGKGKGPYT